MKSEYRHTYIIYSKVVCFYFKYYLVLKTFRPSNWRKFFVLFDLVFFLNFVNKGGKFLIFFVGASKSHRKRSWGGTLQHQSSPGSSFVFLLWAQSFVSTFGQNAHVLLLNYTYKKLKQTENKFFPGQITVTTQYHLSTKDSSREKVAQDSD